MCHKSHPIRPERAKALNFKAFALTGGFAFYQHYPGRCPGLGAFGLSARPWLPLSRLMTHPLNIQHSTLNIQHSTFTIQHSTFTIQHSTFNIQHSTLNIQHSTFTIQHSTFNTQHSTLIQHSTISNIIGISIFCFLILEKCTSSYTILTGLILGDGYLKIKKRMCHLVMTHPLFGFLFLFLLLLFDAEEIAKAIEIFLHDQT